MRLFLLAFSFALSFAADHTIAQAENEAPEDVQAYAVGYEAGSFILERLRTDGVEIDVDALVAGISDALRGSPSRLNETRTRMILQRLEEEVRGREAERLMQTDAVFRALAEDNLRQAGEFLAAFGAEDGVVSLDNGLRYRILAEGAGESPGARDTIDVSFDAELIDGVQFADGSHERFVVGDLNKGAQLAVQMMKPGSRWIVAIPPELAFGLAGRGQDVGPNEAIVVEIELHAVERAE